MLNLSNSTLWNLQKDPTTALQFQILRERQDVLRSVWHRSMAPEELSWTHNFDLQIWETASVSTWKCILHFLNFKKQLSSFVSQATSPLTEFSQHQRFFSSLQSVFHELSFAKQLKGTWAKKLSLMESSVQDVFVFRKRDLIKPVLDRSIEILKTIKPQSFSLFKA